MVEKQEQIIVGVMIKVLKPVTMPPRYKTMFHGQTDLKPSTYVWWYPVKNTEYARLVNEVERWYKGKIRIQYGVMGTMEI